MRAAGRWGAEPRRALALPSLLLELEHKDGYVTFENTLKALVNHNYLTQTVRTTRDSTP